MLPFRCVVLIFGGVTIRYMCQFINVVYLVDYSSSDSDPSEDSLPPTPELLVTSRPSSPSGSSSRDTFAPSSEFPISPVVAPPRIRRRSVILIQPGEAIPFGRPYRTHPNGQRKLLTARKRVGPFPARRLAWRRVSHRSSDSHSSPDFTSDSSSSGLSSDSSSNTSSGSPLYSLSDTSSVHSLGCDASGQTHSGPSTRVTSFRLVYPPVMTPRYSEAFSRWRSPPLSIPYPPTTSDSFLDLFFKRSLDSSSLSARPSRKRCRSATTSVLSSTPVSRSIAHTHVDLLPPRKRFKDSYSLEDSKEEHMEIGTANAEAIADLGIGDGVDTKDGICIGVEIAASDIREDEEEFEAEASARGTMEIDIDPLITGGISESTRGDVPDLEDTLYDIVHYMSEVPFDRITKFKTAQRQLKAGQLMASGAGLTNRIRRLGLENLKDMTITCSGMTPEAIEELIAQRVAEHWLTMRQPVLLTLSRPKVKAKMAMTAIMEMVEIGMEIMKMEETTEMKIQIRMIETLLYTIMVPKEEHRIERYVEGLPDNIQGNVMSGEPTRLQDAIRLANSLIDQKLKGYAIRSAENKRKFKSNQRDNRAQQPPFKR
ncbi:hypothetical protein Tco_0727954 [Tanacetum coccineum]|uniref:Uncharacterized protein n=1 Tax=Tanacetum coccineum TaxID=301880 RepID=A0ABQ4YJV0_9ASTR